MYSPLGAGGNLLGCPLLRYQSVREEGRVRSEGEQLQLQLQLCASVSVACN